MVSEVSAPALDAEALTRMLAEALGLASFQIDDWNCASLTSDNSNPATGGLYRVTGNGRHAGLLRPWSLILKIVHLAEDAPQGWGTDLLHFGYWKREALAYRSGFLKDMSPELQTPRCFGVVDQPDGSVWLWLEDTVENGEKVWPVARYGLAARHIGQWQGHYLTGLDLPASPWLHSGWLRSWVSHFEFLENYLLHPAFWEHPLVRAAFPASFAERLLALWSERGLWMDLLDRMPQTLCHFDTWRPNLLACGGPEGQDKTVLLDWQCMGLGPVGEVGNLMLTSLLTLEVKSSDARELDAAVWEGYLEGLRETGWAGDPRQVRFCYTAYPALRWGLVFPMLMILPYVLDESKRLEAEAKQGKSIEELMSQWADALALLLAMADEARGLAEALRT